MIATIHEITPEEIMAHHDGELSAERDQLVSAHLETCAECRGLARSLSSTSQSLAGWTINATPKLLSSTYNPSSLIGRANSTSTTSFWQLRNRRTALVLGSAFAVVLLALLGITAPRHAARDISLYSVSVDNAKVARPPRTQFKKKRPEVTGEPYQQWLAPNQNSPSTDSKTPGSSSQQDDTALTLGGYDKLPAGAMKAGGGDEGDDLLHAPLHTPRPGLVLAPQSAPVSKEEHPEGAVTAPMIARTVELQIVVKKFDDARSTVQSILLLHQGYAASLNVSDTDNAARTLNASLRIPSQELAAALSDLKALGHVTNESQAGVEVTAAHADLVARLKNSRETEIRLQDILRNRTGKVSDVLEVEQEIARVRGEIEAMESERKTLEHRVDFATVTLSLLEEYKAKVGDSTPGTATRFHNAAIAGFTNVTDSALGLMLWFAEYLPPILFWLAILGIPTWWFWRRSQRAFASAI